SARRTAAWARTIFAGLSCVRRHRLLCHRAAPEQVAVHVCSRSLQFIPCLHPSCAVVARAPLCSVCAAPVRPLLLRQDLHPAVLVSADVLPWRTAGRLPVLPLCANAAAREGRGCDTDIGTWPCRRCRGTAAQHRKRCSQENLAGRRSLAILGGSWPIDSRPACFGRC